VVITLIGLALLAAVFALAMWKGDTAARLGAVVYAGAWIVAIAVELYTQTVPFAVILSLDTLVATAFLILAIRYNSLWLGAGMMLQGMQLGMHAMYFTSSPGVEVFGFDLFALVLNLISMFILITIAGAVGATMFRRARQRRMSTRRPGVAAKETHGAANQGRTGAQLQA
jgi:hypothetical protein